MEREFKKVRATVVVLHPLFWKRELFYLSTVNGMLSNFNNVTEQLMLDQKITIRAGLFKDRLS